jgi:LmbE family N-acetylglucosaminyl deacetylase
MIPNHYSQEEDGRRVLVLSPHPDDAELAAGGTIARLLEEGSDIHYVAFSACEISVPEGCPKDSIRQECLESTGFLGIKREQVTILDYNVRSFPENRQSILDYLVALNRRIKPTLVLIPSGEDTHQDHHTIHWEALRAFKKDASIWGYEHPWNNLTFTTDVFVRLDHRHMQKKIQALRRYETQRSRGYFQEKNLMALVTTRGAQLDIPYAEAFELVRLIF